MRLYVMTGDFMTGKTTWIMRMLDAAKAAGITTSGVVCPAVFEDGKKTGIDAVLLPGGERFSYARLRSGDYVDERTAHRREGSGHGGAGTSAPAVPAPAKLGWKFDPQATERINRNFASAACADCDLLVIDELGPLELVHGEGYTQALQLLDAGAPRNVLAVIRPALLDNARERWGAFEQLSPGSDAAAFLARIAR